MTDIDQELKLMLANLIKDNTEVTSVKMNKVKNGNVYIITVSCL